MFGFRDPIVRGMATAGSAHGLGTAALAAKVRPWIAFVAAKQSLGGKLTGRMATAGSAHGLGTAVSLHYIV